MTAVTGVAGTREGVGRVMSLGWEGDRLVSHVTQDDPVVNWHSLSCWVGTSYADGQAKAAMMAAVPIRPHRIPP